MSELQTWSSEDERRLQGYRIARATRFPSAATETESTRPPSLANFVEATVNFRLDAWQQTLCERLERLSYQSGQRLLIHAPPQAGKSIIVSQRLPAWLLGQKPTARVKLACYNITHAARFGKIVRDLMRSEEYARLFPSPAVRLPEVSTAGEWSTAARHRLRDAQPSFAALGLVTGFVGQGADTLLIDDPYASPQDAYSEIIRESVWTFWEASAKVRLNDATNVVVMFHRYHEDDLAGRLWAQGGWEMLRFAAVADGDPQWPDPLERPEGERLSPRMSDAYLATQQENQLIWLGQFQGRPSAKDGLFFKVAALNVVPAAPAGLRCVRAWDMGATAGGGDCTAGVLMGTDGEGRFWVLDVVRGQWSTDERDAMIRLTAATDGTGVRIRGPQDPGAAGVDAAKAFTRMLSGYSVATERVSGAKETRADPFSSQVNAGNVSLVAAPWNKPFIEELRGFPMGTHDDQVDAGSDAFNDLAPRREADIF